MSEQPRCPKCDEEFDACPCDPLAGTRWATLRDTPRPTLAQLAARLAPEIHALNNTPDQRTPRP